MCSAWGNRVIHVKLWLENLKGKETRNPTHLCPAHTRDECYCHNLHTEVYMLAVAISRSNSDHIRPTLGVRPYDLPAVRMSGKPADL
jgi:hypothetical protein